MRVLWKDLVRVKPSGRPLSEPPRGRPQRPEERGPVCLHRSQPGHSGVVAGPPSAAYCDRKMPSAVASRKLWRDGDGPPGPPQRAVGRRGREEAGLALCVHWGPGRPGCAGSWGKLNVGAEAQSGEGQTRGAQVVSSCEIRIPKAGAGGGATWLPARPSMVVLRWVPRRQLSRALARGEGPVALHSRVY